MSSKFDKIKKELKKRNFERGISWLEYKFIKILFICNIYEYAREFQLDFYFIDFLFPRINLVIELDGIKYHCTKEQIDKDVKKENHIKSKGFRFLRLDNDQLDDFMFMERFLKQLYSELNHTYKYPYGMYEYLRMELPINRTEKIYGLYEHNGKRIDQYGELHPDDIIEEN